MYQKRISLKSKIDFIVKHYRRKITSFNTITYEILNHFYPFLSMEERRVCQIILEGSSARCPCPIEFYFNKKKNFSKVKKILLKLHSKGILNWMTVISYEKIGSKRTPRIFEYEAFAINSKAIQRMANTAYKEILKIRLSKRKK